MGSTQSLTKSGLVYRDDERASLAREDKWEKRGLERLRNLGIPLHRLAMMTRIPNDDVAISSVLCKDCVAAMGSAVYPPPLRHSSEEHGTLIQAVDVGFELNGLTYRITRLNRNDALCVTGKVKQARTRFLPPIRAPIVTHSTRLGWMAGWLTGARFPTRLQHTASHRDCWQL